MAATAASQEDSSVTSRRTEAVALAEPGGGLGGGLLEVADHHPGPGGGQGLGHPLPESLGSSGDEGGASGQVVRRHGLGSFAWHSGWVRSSLPPRLDSRQDTPGGHPYDGRMTTSPARVSARTVRTAADHAARRDALAESALRTLGELGWARTSLREIAANSEFSHGVVHYYFRDKTELITYCVRSYKARCVHRYDGVVATSRTAPGLLEAFADKLVETIVDEAPMHRLWYDLRTTSMFEESLRADVVAIDATLEDMVWRVVSRYAELAGRGLVVTSGTAYAMLDGVFERTLLRHLSGDAEALPDLRATVLGALPLLLRAD